MFGLKRRQKLDIDAILAGLVDSASKMAEGLVSTMPTDRPVTADELRKVEVFVGDLLINEFRSAWQARGISPSAIDLLGRPFEDRFRTAFAGRFYDLALPSIATEGHV